MKEEVKTLAEEYMYDVFGDEKDKTSERFYTYGYLDGYFKEYHYLRQFLVDISIKYRKEYEDGVSSGTIDRMTISDEELEKDKTEWFQKLAVYDAEKGISRHPFSTLEQYKLYQDCKKEAKEKKLRRKTKK